MLNCTRYCGLGRGVGILPCTSFGPSLSGPVCRPLSYGFTENFTTKPFLNFSFLDLPTHLMEDKCSTTSIINTELNEGTEVDVPERPGGYESLRPMHEVSDVL